jgi:hypothetical protein
MLDSRRQLIQCAVSFAALLSLPARVFSQVPPYSSPQLLSSPNAPNSNFPQVMYGPGPKGLDQKAIDSQYREQIHADVEKLCALASDLKQELSVTNTSTVLSVRFVKNAKQIEKLSKHIQVLAKG